jgi:hypothetical protein
MAVSIVPVYVTSPVGGDARQVQHDISSVTAKESLWCSSGCYSLAGGDGTSLKERTSYYNCMGEDAAKRFRDITAKNFPAVAVVVGEERRQFRGGRVYRLHSYDREAGPSYRDYVYIAGATRRSPPAFRLASEPATSDAIKCKAVTVAAPGLVGEAAIMPDGSVIFAAHVVAEGS